MYFSLIHCSFWVFVKSKNTLHWGPQNEGKILGPSFKYIGTNKEHQVNITIKHQWNKVVTRGERAIQIRWQNTPRTMDRITALWQNSSSFVIHTCNHTYVYTHRTPCTQKCTLQLPPTITTVTHPVPYTHSLTLNHHHAKTLTASPCNIDFQSLRNVCSKRAALFWFSPLFTQWPYMLKAAWSMYLRNMRWL